MKGMMTPSNTNQKMFSMGNNEDKVLWDSKEDIHHKDKEEDFDQTIHHSKVIKDINKVTKATQCSRILNKVTRGLHKDEINNKAILEASKISKDTKINLVTHWIPVTMF